MSVKLVGFVLVALFGFGSFVDATLQGNYEENLSSKINADSARGFCGVDSKLGEFGWTARIRRGTRDVCGGSIVDRKHILTSAGCLRDLEGRPSWPHMVVYVGEHDLNSSVEREQMIHIAEVHFYEEQEDCNEVDLALVRLEADIKFRLTKGSVGAVNSIELDTSSARLKVNERLLVAGFTVDEEPEGSSVLQRLEMSVDRCSKGVDWRHYFCDQFGGERDAQLARRNQGSGAVKLDKRNKPKLVGVLGANQEEAVFTRVHPFVAWINDKRLDT